MRKIQFSWDRRLKKQNKILRGVAAELAKYPDALPTVRKLLPAKAFVDEKTLFKALVEVFALPGMDE